MAGCLKEYLIKDKPNYDIRKKIIELNIPQYVIADHVGISEGNLCVWLRKQLSNDDPRRIRIMKAIEEVKS